MRIMPSAQEKPIIRVAPNNPVFDLRRSRDGTNAHPGTLVPSAVTETQNMYLIPNCRMRGVPPC